MRLFGVLAIIAVCLLLGSIGLASSRAADLSPAAAQAVVRAEGGDVPYYARTDGIPHNDEWAVVLFYRPAECIPAGFNLLDFFDIPGAFFCGPPTTAGWAIWDNGPGIDPAPIKTHLQGLGAVPVWLASWPEVEATIADGVLTVPELEGLPSLLKGSASFFTEDLIIDRKLTAVAIGALEDGRRFHAQVTSVPREQVLNVAVVVH